MIKKEFFHKKFSVGLCLNEPMQAITDFLEKNKIWLNSVYFSLPLGSRFYSREALAEEYEGNEGKLFKVLSLLSQLGIRREAAVNTWNLSDGELDDAIAFCSKHELVPEEIVCLREYGKKLSEAFPDTEIKYSVNNPEPDGSGINHYFRTLVAGKGFLRDMDARYAFLNKGYHMTLLLNNGCLPICTTACDLVKCHRYFDYAINRYGLDATFARCSFFPSELGALVLSDPCADQYKFKISNRPLGLSYTQQVLDGYLSLEDDYEAMKADPRKMALFCTVKPLAQHVREIDLETVRKWKEQWKAEMQYGNHRENRSDL